MTDERPADAVQSDAEAELAPDPRRHYATPDELCHDPDLDHATREELLKEWKQDLDRRLEAEAEGMSVSDPISQEREARLAAELLSVSKALETLTQEH